MKKLIPSIAALAAGLLTITVFIVFTSDTPSLSLATFFGKPFSSWWHFGNMLNMAGLLLVASTGACFALKSGTFNLGGEAQIYAPALIAAMILSSPLSSGTDTADMAVRFVLALVACLASGALLGFIPGILKARFRVSELLTSFLLSAALIPVVDFLISGPLRDQGKNLLATPAINDLFRIPQFLKPSLFNMSFFIAVFLAILTGLFFRYTAPGYRLRLTGKAPEFSRFAGFPERTSSIAGMTVSGIFHALTGFFSITGTWYMCHNGFSAGMGWSALAIALIARQNPIALIPAALLYAWLESASNAAVLSTRFSFDSTALVQAVIFFVISAQVFPIARVKNFFAGKKI